jgi:hypothetical protein
VNFTFYAKAAEGIGYDVMSVATAAGATPRLVRVEVKSCAGCAPSASLI